MKPILFSFLLFFFWGCKESSTHRSIQVLYPCDASLFPPDFIEPTFRFSDENKENKMWNVKVCQNEEVVWQVSNILQKQVKIDAEGWQNILCRHRNEFFELRIESVDRPENFASSTFAVSKDSVAAPIFFRSVTLPFKFARENMKTIRWHLGDVSSRSKPHVVLSNIPVCGNCHSFTADGKTIGMDVDARNNKGAYSISEFAEETNFTEESLTNWSDFQQGTFTYGLLSQLSPDGRYVVSTLKDCEIFVDQKDIAYSQLFFPYKGILAFLDRKTKEFSELEGANDTTYVQSNPVWSPDGKYIYFTRAKAKHFEESGVEHGSSPTNISKYVRFEKSYTSRDSLIKFDIMRIPFNNGKGGEPEFVAGASNNNRSNYFPRISPDGKWMVFCQAESFMLLQKDSKLFIVSTEGGVPREMTCNTNNMNSWHSWSPNNRWMVFASKQDSYFTQLYITHIDEQGNDSPPLLLEHFSFDKYANNIPEFVNRKYDANLKITPSFLDEEEFLVRKGEILMEEGAVDEALAIFDKAIKMNPSNAEAYYNRGKAYVKKKQYSKGIADYSESLRLSPTSDALVERGSAYAKNKQQAKALGDYNSSVLKFPNEYRGYTYRGQYYYMAGDLKHAKSDLEKACALNPVHALSQYYLGLVCVRTREYEQSDRCFTEALLRSNSRQALTIVKSRIRVRFALKKYHEIIADCNKTLSKSPNQSFFLGFKALSERELGYEQYRLSLQRAKSLGFREESWRL